MYTIILTTDADPSGEVRGVLAPKADAFGDPFQLTPFSLPISVLTPSELLIPSM